MNKKVCTKCKIEKDLSEYFYKNKKEDKLHSQCKDCYKISRKGKEYYVANKVEYIKRAKKRQLELVTVNREKILKYFNDNPCIDCGETDPIVLEFDHKHNKIYSISEMMRDFTWEQILKEIYKCEVVCSNCHKRRTAKQFGWWKQ